MGALLAPAAFGFLRLPRWVPGSRTTDNADVPIEAPAHGVGGLAPEVARDWLSLQSEAAFHPERLADFLRRGGSPLAALESFRLGHGPSPDQAPLPLDGEAVERIVSRHVALGARLVPLSHADYPDALRSLVDPPLVLGVRGSVRALAGPAVAIVGARAATRAARAFTRRLAFDLARAGLVVVSGLARGIDGEAHRGALEAQGVTVGVLACGLDRIYPPEHRGLAREMLEGGALVSELPLGSLPRPLHFPLRNRIISGLSRAVVVVEARERSGSLITVRHALAQGREVFVVPGSVDGPFAGGTNALLREGARPIRSARDLLEDLGLGASRPSRVGARRNVRGAACQGTDEPADSASATLDPLQARIVRRLSEGPATADDLMPEAGFDGGGLATALLELELAGRIVEERDGRLHLCRAGPSLARDRGPGARSLSSTPSHPAPPEVPGDPP